MCDGIGGLRRSGTDDESVFQACLLRFAAALSIHSSLKGPFALQANGPPKKLPPRSTSAYSLWDFICVRLSAFV